QCLTSAGKADAAGAVLASLAMEPTAGDAVLYELAWSQRTLKQLPEAQKTYRRLLHDHPAGKLAAASRVELAELLYADEKFADAQRGGWESAQKYLALFTQKYPEHAQLPIALLKLGEVQAERSDYAASAQTYETFLARFSTDPQAYRAHFGVAWSLENRKQYE